MSAKLDALLLNADIHDLHQAYVNGETTPSEVVEASLARVAALDANGPALRAMVTLVASRAAYRTGLTQLMDANHLDVLAFPTFRYPPVRNGTVAPEVASPDAPVGSNSYYASLTGFPALSAPMGFTSEGLPLGLQLLALAGDERRLLAAAAWFEHHTGHWHPPPI